MSAVISHCGLYRYQLKRDIAPTGLSVVVVMVNPSTADASKNDPTIKKLIGFGTRNEWRDFTVVNLFAYRATDVNELKVVNDPIGPSNDAYILSAMIGSDAVVFAWGASGKLPPSLRTRWQFVAQLAKSLKIAPLCLGVCDDGHPRHPLMVGYKQPLVQWGTPNA